MDSLPAPLIPPEVDLRDFQFMPLVIGRRFGSDFHSPTPRTPSSRGLA